MTEPTASDAADQPRRRELGPPVDRLSAAGVAGAKDDAVTGKRVSGPAPGVRPALAEDVHASGSTASDMTPQAVIATWKDDFPTFWPKGSGSTLPCPGSRRAKSPFSISRRCPVSPVKLSTGVLVLYADDESFTFMTPEGHTLSAWITFSARRDGDVTSPRPRHWSDRPTRSTISPTCSAATSQNNKFWQATLHNLATTVGVRRPGRRGPGGVHRREPAMAPLAQRPPQRDAPVRAPDADLARPLAHPTGVTRASVSHRRGLTVAV